MTLDIAASTNLLTQLVNPAARAVFLAIVAGLALAAFRVRSTSARLFTWTAVLYAAVAMPLLGRVLPPLAIPTPAFLQQPEPSQPSQLTPVASTAERVLSVTHGPAQQSLSVEFSQPSSALLPVHQTPSSAKPAIPWTTVAFAIYLSVAALLLTRFFVGLAFTRRLLRTSRPITDPRITRRATRIAESDLISVPVTMGGLRSTILLPPAWREWGDSKLTAVLAHEVSHVARRDALTQSLSLLHRAIFWFSPLSWWLDRRLADLAEQASDEAALTCGVDRTEYARTLLGFFEALQASPGRVWWQGVSMAKAGQAEKRVERILAWKGSVAMHLKKSIAVVAIALAVPVVYLVASARPQDAGTTRSITRPIPPVPPLPTARIPVAPSVPMMAMAPIPPVPPIAQSSHSSSRHGNFYSYGYDDDLRFVIVSGKTDSVTMSGSSRDAERAQKLKSTIQGDFIWFKNDDDKTFIIRDQATIARARAFWAPQEELGKKQEELGRQQEILGKQQEELGKKMEQVRVNVPDLSAEMDKLKAELKQMGSTATMDQIGNIQSRIGDIQSKIGDIQSHAGDQQGKIGEEMGALGEQQGKLGEQQGKLGEEQGRLAEQASKQMKQLLDEAVTKGTAQPLEKAPL